jgi:hypothetical protein
MSFTKSKFLKKLKRKRKNNFLYDKEREDFYENLAKFQNSEETIEDINSNVVLLSRENSQKEIKSIL